VQVAGFDDIPTLRDFSPALTTVRIPLYEMGVRAVDLALTHSPDEPRTERVSGEVVLRESTGTATGSTS
jgi:LacI family transcriptional regulator